MNGEGGDDDGLIVSKDSSKGLLQLVEGNMFF